MIKRIILSVLSLIIIMLLGISVSYSIWNISVSQDTNNTAYTECFDLSISNQENVINLENAYPISNDKGKELTPFTFTVTNTCDITAKFSVNLEILEDSTLPSKFIDVMINDNEVKLLGNLDSVNKLNSSSIESKKLSTGYLKANESVDYTLRLWIDYNTTLEDLNNEVKVFKSKIIVVGEPIKDDDLIVDNFDYTGDEQTFTANTTGYYKVETWGAQGGSGETTYIGGYGGYSIGKIFLRKNEVLFINIGGNGEEFNGGYNGGGYRDNNNYVWRGGAGGGATSIAKSSGILHELEEKINDIVLVSGGGGGACGDLNTVVYNGGAGGGFIGTSLNSIATPGSQDTSGIDANNRTTSSFGQGGLAGNEGGGGGGFYGGGSGRHDKIGYSGAGGSGYIGNSLLKDKVMYCYNCEESNEESTKTISTTCNEETPTSYCAKKGNGYARITLISIDE